MAKNTGTLKYFDRFGLPCLLIAPDNAKFTGSLNYYDRFGIAGILGKIVELIYYKNFTIIVTSIVNLKRVVGIIKEIIEVSLPAISKILNYLKTFSIMESSSVTFRRFIKFYKLFSTMASSIISPIKKIFWGKVLTGASNISLAKKISLFRFIISQVQIIFIKGLVYVKQFLIVESSNIFFFKIIGKLLSIISSGVVSYSKIILKILRVGMVSGVGLQKKLFKKFVLICFGVISFSKKLWSRFRIIVQALIVFNTQQHLIKKIRKTLDELNTQLLKGKMLIEKGVMRIIRRGG